MKIHIINIAMKKTTLLLGAFLCAITLNAQEIDKGLLKEIQESFVKDAPTKAVRNALTNDKNIKHLALSNDVAGKVDHFFKYRVDVKGITDQKSSGRCWMFTSMNVLRPAVMKKYDMKEFDFSHNYSFFWDQFEKANLFLEAVIATAGKDMDDREVVTYFKSPIGDGGVWNLFYDVAQKYGVVPQDVMPETEHSDNTSQMSAILKERLRKGGWDLRQMYAAGKKEGELRKAKTAILKDVYRVLALCLGEPPAEFTWRYKDSKGEIRTISTTPLEFYKSIRPDNYNPDNFVMIMNDPTREYHKVYEIENYRNTYEGVNWVYLNLPNEEIKAAALASIKDNNPLYVSCDVGKQNKGDVLDVNNYDYESLFGIDLSMNKKARILTRQSGSSHAMTLIGCDTDDNDIPVKWEFENSWGSASGNKGYLTFTDQWFDEYLFRIVIEKKYLTRTALQGLDLKPVKLPVWDYMY